MLQPLEDQLQEQHVHREAMENLETRSRKKEEKEEDDAVGENWSLEWSRRHQVGLMREGEGQPI